MEQFIDLLKYIMTPANVTANSSDVIMVMYMPRGVKERTHIQRSTIPGPNVDQLGVHQKMPQVDDWKCFFK